MANGRRIGVLESVVSKVLRYGVVTSFSLVLFGCLLLFAEGQTGYGESLGETQLIDVRGATTLGLYPLVQGLLLLKPYAIIYLGILTLLTTPVIRVAVSIPLFAIQRRLAFVFITAAVFTILVLSIFLVGPFVSSSA